MTVLDPLLPGFAFEVGDFIRYEGNEWEILSLDSDEDDMICFRAYNRDTGDDDTIILEPDGYYALLDGDF